MTSSVLVCLQAFFEIYTHTHAITKTHKHTNGNLFRRLSPEELDSEILLTPRPVFPIAWHIEAHSLKEVISICVHFLLT